MDAVKSEVYLGCERTIAGKRKLGECRISTGNGLRCFLAVIVKVKDFNPGLGVKTW